MPHWRSMIESQWLRSCDIEGYEPIVTIVRVVGGEVVGQGGKKSKKPVLYFEGKDKPLAIGATIGKTIERMYGGDVKDWIGKRIKLYVTTTESGGETVPCIRVKPNIPEDPRPQQQRQPALSKQPARAQQQRQPELAAPPPREMGDDGYDDDAARAAAAPTDEEMPR